MTVVNAPIDAREREQAKDDAFRDRLLATDECFCGAKEAPLKCLAHGFCAAHLTPVEAQMSHDDKRRIIERASPVRIRPYDSGSGTFQQKLDFCGRLLLDVGRAAGILPPVSKNDRLDAQTIVHSMQRYL